MQKLSILKGMAVLVLSASALLFAQSAPKGMFKQSIEKSNPAPRNPQTRTMEVNGDTQTYSVDGMAGNGNKVTWSYTAKYDGKEYPITGTGPMGADTIAMKQVNPSTTEETFTKAGKVVEITVSEISSDGKLLTVTATGTNQTTGQPFKNVLVFDKQ